MSDPYSHDYFIEIMGVPVWPPSWLALFILAGSVLAVSCVAVAVLVFAGSAKRTSG